jgi:hypothetical protein
MSLHYHSAAVPRYENQIPKITLISLFHMFIESRNTDINVPSPPYLAPSNITNSTSFARYSPRVTAAVAHHVAIIPTM